MKRRAIRLADRARVLGVAGLVLMAMGLASTHELRRLDRFAVASGLLLLALALFLDARANRRGMSHPRIDGWRVVQVELERARRFGLSLVVARIPVSGSAQHIERVSERLSACIRRFDLAWVEDDAVMLMLTGVDRVHAERVISDKIAAERGLQLELVGIAAFPDDGLTVGGLMDRLDRDRPFGDREPRGTIDVDAALRLEPDLAHDARSGRESSGGSAA